MMSVVNTCVHIILRPSSLILMGLYEDNMKICSYQQVGCTFGFESRWYGLFHDVFSDNTGMNWIPFKIHWVLISLHIRMYIILAYVHPNMYTHFPPLPQQLLCPNILSDQDFMVHVEHSFQIQLCCTWCASCVDPKPKQNLFTNSPRPPPPLDCNFARLSTQQCVLDVYCT